MNRNLLLLALCQGLFLTNNVAFMAINPLVGLSLAPQGWLATLPVTGVLYTGGSTLLLSAYRAEEKNKAQGMMDFCVFATMAASSFASGALVTTQGWAWLNLGSLLPLMLVVSAIVWLARRRRAGLSEVAAASPAGR